MGSAEVLAAPTDKVQFMEDMKNEVRKSKHNRFFLSVFLCRMCMYEYGVCPLSSLDILEPPPRFFGDDFYSIFVLDHFLQYFGGRYEHCCEGPF